MPLFYKGAGVGTHWHTNDPQQLGFTARSPNLRPSTNRIRSHIALGTATSPYVSLSRSYAVAWSYAVFAGSTLAVATRSSPGYVYEIEIDDPLPVGLRLIDPIKTIAGKLTPPLQSVTYKHEGLPEYLLGVVLPRVFAHLLSAPCPQPPHAGFAPAPHTGWGGPPSAPPTPSLDMRTLIFALRDSELLAYGTIPAACVTNRWDVWL